MRRRDIVLGGLAISSVAAAATARHAVAVERAARIYRVGFLTTSGGPAPADEIFEASLAALGYQEHRNLVIERRYAAGEPIRLSMFAADLVRANVDVIVTQTTLAALAAKKATTQIPIVMATAGDPVGSGLVASLARPGGNVTGVSSVDSLIDGKKVELLQELKPDAKRVVYFGNSENIAEQTGFRDVQKTATALGMDALFVNVPRPAGFETAFARRMPRIDVGIVPPPAPNLEARREIAEFAARFLIPTAYGRREFVEAGGLISYGISRADVLQRAATVVDRILKGANPADIPVEHAKKLELVINLRAAKALGITVPRSLLVRADEVIG